MNKHLRRRMKEHWEKLTDSELERVEGQASRLLTLLQRRYGYDKQEAERALLEFLDDSLIWAEQQRYARRESIATAPVATAS